MRKQFYALKFLSFSALKTTFVSALLMVIGLFNYQNAKGQCTINLTSAGPVILYDQNNNYNASAGAVVSQQFGDFASFSTQSADDFTVPAGPNWTVSRVVVGGQYFNGTGPAPSVNVYFYSDASGLPGALVTSITSATITAGAASGNFTLDLGAGVSLPPGNYWISVEAVMDFGTGGEWGWNSRTLTNGNLPSWQNPGGGFGGSCPGTTWAAITPCIAGVNDLMFSVWSPGTDNQTVCINTPITDITYATTGATGATFSGLPAGVTGSWAGNVVTITGTPTVAGVFNYTVTLTGAPCSGETATGTITVSDINTITLTSAPPTVLYDQNNNYDAAVGALVSQEFGDFPTYNTFSADDFTVPAGPNWTVSRVIVSGQYFNGTGPAPLVNVYFYQDNGGLPGTLITSFSGVTISAGAATGNFTVDLPSTVILPPGTYWMSVTAAMDFGTGGEWGWNASTNNNGNIPAWQNPAGGFGGCPPATWDHMNNCGTSGSDDLMFSVWAPGSDNQTVCVNNAITDITYSTTGAIGATVTGLPAGVTGTWAANVVTITGTPTVTGVFTYTVTLIGGTCAPTTATGTITVTDVNSVTLTSAAGTDNQTVCQGSPITDITYATTGATGVVVTGLPAGVTGSWASNVVTITGTPTASGVFNYTVNLTGGGSCGTTTATGTITVTAQNTITLTSAPPTVLYDQNNNYDAAVGALVSQEFGDLPTYNTFSADDFTVPAGPNWTVSRVIVSGQYFNGTGPAPAVNVYFYNDASGLPGALVTSFSGVTISAGAASGNFTIDLPSTVILPPGTYWVSVTAAMDFAAGGEWGWNASTNSAGNLPAWQNPAGGFGGCPPATWNYINNCGTSGSDDLMFSVWAPGSDVQTVCVNTPIVTITYATTGATGATFSGLPPGVTGSWAANVVTISGTPTAVGVYNYIVTLTGGCGNVTATGTITVTDASSVTLTSAAGTDNQSVCNSTPITDITYATTGGSGVVVTGLPTGVTGTWAANVITISGTPTQNGVFNYTVNLTGGGPCGSTTATGTITVTALNTITLTSAPPVLLYDQNNNYDAAVGAIVSQQFGDFPTYTTPSADDFTVPAGPNWTVSRVIVSGQYFNGTGPAPTVNVYFYNDAAGLPGTLVTSYSNLTVTAGAASGNFTVDLGAGVNLAPGTYWVSVQAVMDFGTGGEWGWNARTISAGNLPAWENPGGGFAGCPPAAWDYISNCGTSGGDDLMFSVWAPGSDNQTVCVNTPIVDITYATTGATGATFSGLPPGVTGSWAANVVTISGTPTATGVYTFIVTLTGGCGNITASGTITVTPPTAPVALTSAPGTDYQIVPVNTPITNITYSVSGTGTGATVVNLPPGVTGTFSGGIFTISGTPTAVGVYHYTVTAIGGCGSDTGTIIVTTPLPVTFISLNGYQKSTGSIQLDWRVANETGIDHYEAERSLGGITFAKIGNNVPSAGSSLYTLLDQNPNRGVNFYRVKAVDISGQKSYTNIVKVVLGITTSSITITPNPIIGNQIGLQFNNEIAGLYNVKLYNGMGQLLLQKVINHGGGSSTQTIELPYKFSQGIYHLEIMHPDNTVEGQKIIVSH